jgi:hypothetical protein
MNNHEYREFLGRVDGTTRQLLAYCQSNDWSGWDPYDALNSRLLESLPFLASRFPQIALTQALKRSPLNIRALARIPKTQNPKAMALFLSAALKLDTLGSFGQGGTATALIDRLVALRSPQTPHWCWGYSFPWQTRTVIVPRGAPNLVCTTFVANALLDAYEQLAEPRLLEMASSAANYIVNDLSWTDGDEAGFSYPLPSIHTRVHNANLLGAALLCRVRRHTGDDTLLAPALRIARYSASRQRDDGSWPYGELESQHWIDNFHTGYNLSGLHAINQYLGTTEFEPHIRRGFAFYREHFFREDGAARYFHNRTFPIDVHCVAQSLITLLEFRHLDETSVAQAASVFKWTMTNMWDERGYFHYRVLPFYRIKTSYMRWSQAWMLLALTTVLRELTPAAVAEAALIEEAAS